MTVHSILVGPAEDLRRVRCPKHGGLEASGRGLMFKLNDGRRVALVVDDYAALMELAADMIAQVPEAQGSIQMGFAQRALRTWAEQQRTDP